MKPRNSGRVIETAYGGCRFRSRLEARYAVFFDSLGIRWEYEKEGFRFAGGVHYLPDFYLPDLQIWIEIKGVEPTKDELQKCFALAEETGHAVYLLWGSMEAPSYRSDGSEALAFLPERGPKGLVGVNEDDGYLWCECEDCGWIGLEFRGFATRLDCWTSCPRQKGVDHRIQGHDTPRLIAAFEAARSARFEHRPVSV